MQGKAARRAGDPSHQSEDPPPEGLGGHGPFGQTDARCPAGEVVCHHLHRQPGAVGGEAPRGEMVESDAVFQVSWRHWNPERNTRCGSASIRTPRLARRRDLREEWRGEVPGVRREAGRDERRGSVASGRASTAAAQTHGPREIAPLVTPHETESPGLGVNKYIIRDFPYWDS